MENLENQELNSDVESGISSEPEQSSQNTQQTGQTERPLEQEAQTAPKEEQTPFHLHPRWKEMVEQKNEALGYAQNLAQKYKELEQRLNKMSEPQIKDEVYEQIKAADPRVADYLKETRDKALKVDELMAQLQESREEQFRSQAVSNINSLHSENKVAQELQPLYNRLLDNAYRSGEIKSEADVKQAYKSIHEMFSKTMESVKRAEREAYVKTKQSDAKAPSAMPPGKAVSHAKPPEFSKDPAQAKAQLIQRVLSLSKQSGQDV